MFVYYFTAIFVAVFSILAIDRKIDSSRIVFVFFVSFFTLLIGLRWGTTDFFNYLNHFYLALESDSLTETTIIFRDVGDGVLLYILTRFFSEPTFYFLTYAGIAIGSMFYVFKKTSPFFSLSVFIYVTNGAFHQDLAQMRQGLTSSLVLLALYYLYQNRRFIWFFLVGLSSTIHFSSAPAILTYFFKHLKYKNILYFFLFISFFMGMFGGVGQYFVSVFGSLISFIIGDYQFARLVDYLDYDEAGLSLGFLTFGFLFSFLFLIFYNRLTRVSPIIGFFISIHVFGSFILVSFQDLGYIVYRLSDTLTYGVEPVIWAALVRSFKGYDQVFVLMFVLAFFLLKFFSTVTSSSFNYSFVFMQ